ncbi:CKLF-like MARVEL transmembrane domain-containing protein 4 [Microplitis demolitor]|uniref:CKLF-like MARVEL transmembrane domain-containing protein 4 n=1 Tax=Microplitis demolitor TaxID=69319 RepID=UPI0004CDCD5A|nr:CKLF-like MARVEL transmembrane domain-containing protein 4 [Microplitis demolitor]XP_008555225.1 CKLF-like MARVEL transmembrane domain-containing protein 4 [Microplitis demolitor]XP_008555226.1 CKLF-like MARVEL transmembrane domain-containing protein 4 [Microplitis demolitor]
MNQEFPGQHVTTTTTTTSSSTFQRSLRFDPSYFRTMPGILKIIQMVLDILGFICIAVSNYAQLSRGAWFNTVAMVGFWCTGILLASYVFHVIEKLYKIPWLTIEFFYCGIMTACYLLAASLAADYAHANEGFGAAAFFGFCAMVCYGYDTWLKFKARRSGVPPQGQHDVTKQVSTVTSPAY